MSENKTDPEIVAPAGLDRRRLMQRFGMGAVGAAALGSLAAGGLSLASAPAEAATLTDADILNFALNLEYLEAEYYLRAVTGQGLSAADTTGTYTQGAVTGGSKVPFKTQLIADYAADLAVDEQAHVRFLRAALGSAAVAEPTIDLQTSFTNLAIAGGLIQAGQTFNPFADEVSFLLGSFIFEDVGVTAYAGAARSITNKDYLEAAAAILGTEAYHAGGIRTLLSMMGAGTPVKRISDLRATLSGVYDDMGIVKPSGTALLVPEDSNALVFRRNTNQVLNIVYGGGAASNFLFFPNRVNGLIN